MGYSADATDSKHVGELHLGAAALLTDTALAP